jgi:hypothetical protein
MKVYQFFGSQKEGIFSKIRELAQYKEQVAQDTVLALLSAELNNDYALLCNYPLPDVGVNIPMTLVGPTGVRSMLPSGARGTFRAKGRDWLEFDSRKRKFNLSKTNLIDFVDKLALVTKKYLRAQGIDLQEVEPVLLFSDPLTQIDLARPSVRIVPHNAIARFAQGLLSLPVTLDREQIVRIIHLLSK